MPLLRAVLILCISLGGMKAQGQLPKLSKVLTPSSDSKSAKDESGLFTNVTDDNIAYYKRRDAAGRLNELEAEYKKTSVDYKNLRRITDEAEKLLADIMKLEPKVNRSKFDERYLPLKSRADKDLAQFDKVSAMGDKIEKDYGGKTEACRCGGSQPGQGYAGLMAAKKEYDDAAAQLQGYADFSFNEFMKGRERCREEAAANASKQATEGMQRFSEYFATLQAGKPDEAIKECSEYIRDVESYQNDISMNFDATTIKALADAKAAALKMKTDEEAYVSSGGYQKYLDQKHAAEIARVFMPKDEGQNTTLEAGATAEIKSADFASYLKGKNMATVATTMRVVSEFSDWGIKKNDYGTPERMFQFFSVAYKGSDGKCYLGRVVANRNYLGGGTYDDKVVYGFLEPVEMACENVNVVK